MLFLAKRAWSLSIFSPLHTQAKDTPDAPAAAQKELAKLGPLSLNEKITAFAFAVTVALWICGGSIGVNAVSAGIVGLTILLVSNVITWKVRMDTPLLAPNAGWLISQQDGMLQMLCNHRLFTGRLFCLRSGLQAELRWLHALSSQHTIKSWPFM